MVGALWSFESFVPFERAEIEQSIPALFARQLASHARRPAVTKGDVTWTYGALNRAANRLAHRLRARREAPAPVVLLIEQSVQLIAAILGVLGGHVLRTAGVPRIAGAASGRAAPLGALPPPVSLLGSLPEGRGDDHRADA